MVVATFAMLVMFCSQIAWPLPHTSVLPSLTRLPKSGKMHAIAPRTSIPTTRSAQLVRRQLIFEEPEVLNTNVPRSRDGTDARTVDIPLLDIDSGTDLEPIRP